MIEFDMVILRTINKSKLEMRVQTLFLKCFMSAHCVKTNGLIGIDLFSGAGGLSLGANLAGITVSHAIELDPRAAETYRLNHQDTVLIEKDVRDVNPSSLKIQSPFIVFGGPPCQGFSTSNQRTRTRSNSNNWMFQEIFRFTECLRPNWVVLENVRGLKNTAGGFFMEEIVSGFKHLNYSVKIWDLAASDYGVPQRRHRLFFVCRKAGEAPDAPKKSNKKHITVHEAIADLPELRPGASHTNLPYRDVNVSSYARSMRGGAKFCDGHLVTKNNDLVLKRYKYVLPGGNWRSIPEKLMRNYAISNGRDNKHTGLYHRLAPDEPSVVIANYRKNMLIHPEQDRGLSVREAARLQSFPDVYRFAGSIGFQQQQVSNAVPPLLAKSVFEHIIRYSK